MSVPVDPSMLLPPNDIDAGWTWGQLEAYANQLYAEVLAGRARLARLEEANVELLRDTAKHELRLANAERERSQALDRAVCSGCGQDVDEGGSCSTAGCDWGEIIPSSDLPEAVRGWLTQHRESMAEWNHDLLAAEARVKALSEALRAIADYPHESATLATMFQRIARAALACPPQQEEKCGWCRRPIAEHDWTLPDDPDGPMPICPPPVGAILQRCNAVAPGATLYLCDLRPGHSGRHASVEGTEWPEEEK